MPAGENDKVRSLYQYMVEKQLLDTTKTSPEVFNNNVSTDEGRKDIFDYLSSKKLLGNVPYEEFDADLTGKHQPKPVTEPVVNNSKETPTDDSWSVGKLFTAMAAYQTANNPVLKYFFGTPIGTVGASVLQKPGQVAVTAPNTLVSWVLSAADANAKLNTPTGIGMIVNDALDIGIQVGQFTNKLMSGELFLPSKEQSAGDKLADSIKEDLHKKNAKLFNSLAESDKVPTKAIEKMQLDNYQRISDINKVFNAPFETYKGEYKNNFWLDQVPGGISQTSMFVLGGYTVGAMGFSPAMGTMLTGALAESGGQLPEAWNALQKNEEFKKLSDGDKARIMGQVNLFSAATGTTEAMPIGAQLRSIGQLSSGIFKNINRSGLINKALSKDGLKTFVKFLRTGAVGGGEEFLQEGLQTGLENYTAKELYDASRELSDGVFESAAVGGISGLVLSMFGLAVSIKAQRTQDREEKQLLEKVKDNISEVFKKNEVSNVEHENLKKNTLDGITERMNTLYPEVNNNVVKGWNTPVTQGQEFVAGLGAGMLPTGTFIALDKPYGDNTHNEADAKSVEMNLEGKNIYNPDGLQGFEKTPYHDMTTYINKNAKSPNEVRPLMTKFLVSKGYDGYVRGIDGQDDNRELIVFNPQEVKGAVKQELKPVTYQELSNGDEELTKQLRGFVESFKVPKENADVTDTKNWFDDEVFRAKQSNSELTPEQAEEEVHNKFLNEYARVGIPGTSVTGQQVRSSLHNIISNKAIMDLDEILSPERPVVKAESFDELNVPDKEGINTPEIFNEESVNILKTEFKRLAESGEPLFIDYTSSRGRRIREIRDIEPTPDGFRANQYENGKLDPTSDDSKRNYVFKNLRGVSSTESMPVQSTQKSNIDFQEEQTSGYRNRTIKNASADATIALAVDFNSAGERLTKSSVLNQKKKYIPVDANRLEVTQERVDKIVEQLNSVNAKTLNIAGNGIYTMKGKYTQQQVDDFTYELLSQVLNSSNLKTKIESIRTGGQTGFDEAGAKAGLKLGIPISILAPKGWTFRDITGKDISNEQQFKARFGIEGIQSMAQPVKVAPSVTVEANKGNLEGIPKTISGFMDEIIKGSEGVDKVRGILARQVKENASGLEIRFVNSGFTLPDGTTMENRRGTLVVQEIKSKRSATAYINSDFVKGDSEYDSALHEGFHFILREFLSPTSAWYNADFALKLAKLADKFYNEIKGSEVYTDNQGDFDRIFALKDSTHKAEEFLVHLLTNTSPTLTALAKETSLRGVKNPTNVWQQFIKYIIEAWERHFGKGMSYYDAVNALLSKYTTIKTTDTFWDSGAIQRNGDNAVDENLSDSEIFSNEAQAGEMDVKSLTVIGRLLALEEGFATLDYISYIQTMTLNRLKVRLEGNKEWNKKVEDYYNFKYKDKKKTTLSQYKDHLAKSIWENAQQKKLYSTVRLTAISKKNPKGEWEKSYTVNDLGLKYRDNKNAWKDGYHTKTRLDERVKQFSELFGVELELVYVDQVYETYENDKVFKTWKINSTNGLTQNRNGLISEELAKAGYLFLGTFSDKQTVVAFKLKDKTKENNGKVIEGLNNFRKLYLENAQNCADALGYNEKQKEQFTPGYDKVSNSNILRIVLEDMKLGGQMTQEGWKSALYNPEDINTYDIVKILKRSVEVAPLGATYINREENVKLVENLKKKGLSFGISVNEKTGDLDFNSVIFNSETTDREFKVKIAGREFTFNMKDMLKNRMGTETTDGIIVWSHGAKEAYSQIHSTIKEGAVKAWAGNLLGEDFNDPLFLKASWQTTNSDLLTKWMKDNNISVIISDTSAKINTRYSKVDLLGTVDTEGDMKSFKMPLSAINKDKEKGGLIRDAKGLAQSFTSNVMAFQNGFFVDKGVGEAVEFLLNRLSDEFQNTMMELSPEAILGYVIERAYNSSSTIEADRAQTLLKFFIDKDFYEMVAKDINARGKVALNDYTKLRELGDTSFAALYEPMFKDIYQRFVTNAASNVYNFKAPASWTVLSADWGWLESKNIEKIYNWFLDNTKPLNDLQTQKQKVKDELEFYAEKTSDAKDESDLDEILKHTGKLHKRLSVIDKRIDFLGKGEDELTPEEKEARSKEAWDKVSEVIDFKTGRLNKGWGYLEESYKEEFNLEQEDKFIVTAVPSDGMTSQQAVKIAAFISGKDENIAILNSEHTQTIIGKDFDIDTMHLLFRDSRYFTYDTYDKFWDTIFESNEKYYSDVVSVYKKVLKNTMDGSTLTFDSVHTRPVQLAFMQTLFQTGESSTRIFSLARDLEVMNNKFAKDIGAVINQRKIFTTILQLGVTSGININDKHIDIGKLTESQVKIAYLMLMRLTNDRVDSPTNDNLLYYNFNEVIFYNLLHGTKFDPSVEEDNNYVKGLNLAERFLFYYGNKITAEKNIDNRDDDYTLKEMIEYIAKQQQINKALDSKDRTQLLQIFDEWLMGFKKPEAIITDGARAYLGGLSVKNSTDKSFAMNAINKFELQNIPNVELSQPVYAKWKYNTLNLILSSKNILSPGFYKLLSDAKEEYAKRREPPVSKLFADVDDIKVKNRSVYSPELQNIQYMTVASYPTALWLKSGSKIKDLQWTAIDFMYPRAESFSANTLTYLKDFQMLANGTVYPVLMGKFLEADSPVFIKEHYSNKLKKDVIPPKSITFKHDGREITLTRVGDTDISIDAIGVSKVKFHWDSLAEFNTTLIEEGDSKPAKIANAILQRLTSKNGVMSDINNRNLLSSFINLSASVPFASKLDSTVEYLKENIDSLSEAEQEMLWTSLMAFPSAVDVKNTYSLVKQNKEKLYHQSLLFSVMNNFPSGIRYMQKIAPLMTEAFEDLRTIGIGSYVNIKNVLGRTWFGGDSIEIWDQLNKSIPSELADKVAAIDGDFVDTVERDDIIEVHEDTKDIVKRIPGLDREELTQNLTVENLIQSISALVLTDTMRNNIAGINPSLKAYAAIKALKEQFNTLRGEQRISENNIRNILDRVLPTELREKTEGEYITKAVELHQYGGEELSRVIIQKVGRGYIYILDNQKYSYSSLKDKLSEVMKLKGMSQSAIDIELAVDMVALEFKKTEYNNRKLVNKVVEYLHYIKQNDIDLQWSYILDPMIKKYEDLQVRMNNMNGIYYPHVFEKPVLHQIFTEEIKKRFPNLSDEVIKEIVDKKILKIQMRSGNFGNKVYGFLEKRFTNDERYIKDNISPLVDHQKMFYNMLENNMLQVLMAEYEEEARFKNSDEDTIRRVKYHFQMIGSGEKVFRQRSTNLNKVKKGSRVVFFWRGIKREGTFDHVTKDRVHFEVDKDAIEKYTLNALKNTENTRSKVKEDTPIADQSFFYDKYYKDLVEEGYIEEEEHTKLEVYLDDIINGLKAKLADRDNWGSLLRSEVSTKKYSNIAIRDFTDAVDVYEGDSVFNPSIKRVRQVLHMLSLGGFAAPFNNYMDSLNGLIRTVGIFDYYQSVKRRSNIVTKAVSKGIAMLPGTKRWEAEESLIDKTKDILNTTEEEITKYLDLLDKTTDENKILLKVKRNQNDLIIANVMDYMFEFDLLGSKLDDAGQRMMDKITALKGKSNGKVAAAFDTFLQTVSGFTTKPFGKVEVANRIRAAYSFAYEAIVLKKLTDPKEIRDHVRLGVEMTQSAYEMFDRKLGERTEFGKFLYQYAQYNHYQRRVWRSEKLLRKLNQETWKDAFQKGTVTHLMAKQILYDITVGVAVQTILPGVRAGNPVTRPYVLAVGLGLNFALMNIDPDEDDWKNLITSLLAFRIGMGITLPLMAVWNLLIGKEGWDINPIHPKFYNSSANLVMEIYDRSGAISRSNYDRVQKSAHFARMTEKFFTGNNIIFGGYASPYLSEKENYYRTLSIFEKIAEPVTHPVNTFESVAPPFNLLKGFRIK